MLNRLSRPAVRLVERWLPDAYLLVLLLTLVAATAAMLVERQTPLAVLRMWGGGFWELLAFSMQMLLVLVTGFMLASTPPVKHGLQWLAKLARGPGMAIVLVSLVSLTASWINWGFGLVVGALFARELAAQVRVDYRLLVASAYSGFVVWHGGLAGSIPLTIATEGHFMAGAMGVVPTSQTIFAFYNLAIVALLFVLVPLVNRWMLPAPEESVFHRPGSGHSDGKPVPPPQGPRQPADRLEDSRLLAWLVGLAGIGFLVDHFIGGGGLNLNIVNFGFLMLAIVLHGTPRRLLASLQLAIKGGAGIVIQFPFYAGIMAIMVKSGLAATLSQSFVSVADADTLPFWSFIAGGVLNVFVPSGGGQWAVQAPIMVPAAEALGADVAKVAMGVAWGDAWTNLIQPFWALPMLALAGLKARDIMGFCLIQLVVTGVVIGGCLLLL
ncbi:short-chain fatty acid transporter [Marilutibacter alkalisoli]|uniref:Short-chain fatty acid transporter n=1 Tax=Marilutibacter alkalisoli TaxID=2591633 RepID=A0A514BPA7_9GAMM|nr:TIGR00366 family protein [Lysobacter alkalisoli]QDH69212.1 short-chain fatty acid transporter [Lysobacter alkalisoli]